jgi:hypothetical protein
LIFIVIFKITSQIKSPYFNVILKISKSSQNDLRSDFVKSSIKSLNTLIISPEHIWSVVLRVRPPHSHPPHEDRGALLVEAGLDVLDRSLGVGPVTGYRRHADATLTARVLWNEDKRDSN